MMWLLKEGLFYQPAREKDRPVYTQEPGILASQPADSLAPGDSWEGGRMEPLDASLLPPADNAVLLRGQNPSLSSEARQPSSSVEPSSSTPPVPGKVLFFNDPQTALWSQVFLVSSYHPDKWQ